MIVIDHLSGFAPDFCADTVMFLSCIYFHTTTLLPNSSITSNKSATIYFLFFFTLLRSTCFTKMFIKILNLNGKYNIASVLLTVKLVPRPSG